MGSPEPSSMLNSPTEQLPSVTENGPPRRRRKLRDASSLSSSTTSSNGTARKRIARIKRKKLSEGQRVDFFLRRCKQVAVEHSWTIPLLLLLVFLSLYAVDPTESNVVHHFIFLSYKQPVEAGADPSTPPQYGKGIWDIAFVSFYVIVLSFTREFIMQELLRPLARFCGIGSRGKQLRFMEQMYTAIYFAHMGSVGMYVMHRTPVWYFNTRGMYESFPHKTHDAVFKFYYLFQAAYWAQQALVMLLGLEKRRKDFKELVGHHIITLALVALSYQFHFTYLGIAVYITHDISDFFLALSKSLHYIGTPLVELYYGTSIGAWIYMRHYLNLCIIFSLFTEFRTVGPYELDWETQQYKCLISNVITFALLASLQGLNLFWLYCLLRSGYRLVVYNIAKDDRSEVEESELEEMERKKNEALPILDANGAANGSANGVIRATSNGTAAPKKRKRDL